jgi:transposase
MPQGEVVMTENTQQTERKLRRWTAAEKAHIVRRHLQEKVSLADLADEYKVAPGQISAWCKQDMEGLEGVFAQSAKREDRAATRELAARNARINQLQEVVTELSEEVLRLKKPVGRTLRPPRLAPGNARSDGNRQLPERASRLSGRSQLASARLAQSHLLPLVSERR